MEKKVDIMGKKVGIKESIGYFLGGFGGQLANRPISSYLLIFFTNCLLLDPALAGLIFMIGRFADGIIGLFIGNVIDKTKTRWGTYRPYLLLFAIPLGLTTIMCFSSPSFLATQTAKLIWAGSAYFLSQSICKMVCTISYSSLAAVMTNDGDERAKLAGFRSMGENTASLAVSYFTMTIVLKFGTVGNPKGWFIMALIYAIIIPLGYLTTFATSKENIEVIPKGKDPLPLKERIKALKGNKPLFILMAIMLILMLITMSGGMLIAYYIMYNLGHPNWLAGIMTIGALAAIGGSFLISPIAIKFEKRYAFVFGSLCWCIAGIFLLFMPNYYGALIFLIFINIGGTLNMGSIWGMVPDIADYGEWKNGVSSPALVFSFATLTLSLGTGIGSYVIGIFLKLIGFNARLPIQAATTLSSINTFLCIVCPCISLIALVLSFFLKDIDHDNKTKLAAEIAKRKAGAQ